MALKRQRLSLMGLRGDISQASVFLIKKVAPGFAPFMFLTDDSLEL